MRAKTKSVPWTPRAALAQAGVSDLAEAYRIAEAFLARRGLSAAFASYVLRADAERRRGAEIELTREALVK